MGYSKTATTTTVIIEHVITATPTNSHHRPRRIERDKTRLLKPRLQPVSVAHLHKRHEQPDIRTQHANADA